jgi:hypothetical protein
MKLNYDDCLNSSVSSQFNQPADAGGLNLAQAVANAKAWVTVYQIAWNPRERVTEMEAHLKRYLSSNSISCAFRRAMNSCVNDRLL